MMAALEPPQETSETGNAIPPRSFGGCDTVGVPLGCGHPNNLALSSPGAMLTGACVSTSVPPSSGEVR